MRRRGIFRLIDFFAEILQHVGGALKRPPASSCVPKGLDLFAYRRLITREISGELRQLRGEKTPHCKNERKGEYGHAHDRQPARHVDTLQYYDHRRQYEAEKNRQCNGL